MSRGVDPYRLLEDPVPGVARYVEREEALALDPPVVAEPDKHRGPGQVATAVLASTAVVAAASALTLLATACAHAPATSSQASYTACMRSHGVRDFPDPSATGVIVVDASTGISRDSATVQSAERACRTATAPRVKWPRVQAPAAK
jgi:hypothetical protein